MLACFTRIFPLLSAQSHIACLVSSHCASRGIGDKTRQAMHRFSLVEHASYPASIRFVGKERQNIDGLEQASILLQATMDEVLVVERLQFGHQEDRRHGAVFEGRGNAMHIIPAPYDQVPLDRLPAKERP